jgi:hypothetical protein
MIIKGRSWCKATVTMTFVLAVHTLKRLCCHYYRLTYHYRHFHCHSNRSDCVMLPPLVGPIERPLEEENR